MSVLVLGMHRSGTSVATRMVSLMGLSLCETRHLSVDRRGNERGVWESDPLVRFNDRVLAAAGGAWWCPPPLGHDWGSQVANLGPEAHRVFASSHRGPHWLWKDPRNCVTLPFWLRALGIRPPVIVMLRDPREVSASLTARNQFSTHAGLALWERSLRAAVGSLDGLPVLVSTHDALVSDPDSWISTVASFLRDTGHPHSTTRAHLAAGYVQRAPSPSRGTAAAADEEPRGALSAEQQRLEHVLDDLVGSHPRFAAPDLGPETPGTELFFAAQRQAHRPPQGRPHRTSQGDVTAVAPGVRDQLFSRSTRESTDRRGREPKVSVVVITHNEGARLSATVDSLLDTGGEQLEVVVVDDHSTDGSLATVAVDARVRCVRSDVPLGIARARNLGAARAVGEVLVFSDAHVTPAPGWVPAMVTALDQPATGAVNPLLAQPGQRHTANGLAFDGPELNVRWLSEPWRTDAFVVPLLAGCFLGVRREVFSALGGFDGGMTGYGAEDLELCLRLWRMGYECRSVPGARVEHRFKPAGQQRIDRTGFLHNVLRMGTLHLSPWRMKLLLDTLRPTPGFARAMAQVLTSDVGRRRAVTGALSWYADDLFFQRFGPTCYAAPPPTSTSATEEVA